MKDNNKVNGPVCFMEGGWLLFVVICWLQEQKGL